MAFTPLHGALGLPPSPLEYSMIQAAVDRQVTERIDIDWKSTLPDKQRAKEPEEFAKDIAAMVNVGGGVVVYGVTEDRASSAAAKVVGVEGWSDAVQRMLLGWAHLHVHPPVHGLQFTTLQNDQGEVGGSPVVVMQVPASFETPHLVMVGDSIKAPRRSGSRTVYMNEREIERAYRARFDDRRSHERQVSDLLDQVLSGIRPTQVWLAAAARPINPRPVYAGRVPEEVAGEIFSKLRTSNPFRKDGGGMEEAGVGPRIGYRKWRLRTQDVNGSPWSVVDLHDDGSVALAFIGSPSGESGFEASTDVHVMDAQSLPAYIVRLARTAAESLGIMSDYEVSLTMKAAGKNNIYIRTFRDFGRLRGREDLIAIHDFEPVRGVFPGVGDDADALTAVRTLAVDIMNQGGHTTLGDKILKTRI